MKWVDDCLIVKILTVATVINMTGKPREQLILQGDLLGSYTYVKKE